jgi:RNase P subunit RPR2
MDCPNCNKPVIIPARATFNADQYSKACHTIVECCGAIIVLMPIRSYRLQASDALEDDWGYERSDGTVA